MGEVSARCLSLTNTAAANSSQSISYNLTNGIEIALQATAVVLARFDELDRRAPN